MNFIDFGEVTSSCEKRLKVPAKDTISLYPYVPLVMPLTLEAKQQE